MHGEDNIASNTSGRVRTGGLGPSSPTAERPCVGGRTVAGLGGGRSVYFLKKSFTFSPAPAIHSASITSGLYSPIFVISPTSPQTLSGGASTCRLTVAPMSEQRAICVMAFNNEIQFGIGLETDVVQVGELLAHAHFADDAGLDIVSLTDHPYFAERIDAYAALAFVLGATDNVTAAVIMTNLLSRPAPVLARTAAGLSTMSGGRFILGIGVGGLWEEIIALGVPRLSPAARYERWRRRSRW